MTKALPTKASLEHKSRIAMNISWLSYTLVLLMLIITSLPGQTPEGASIGFILTIKLLPLLIILPGLMKSYLRSFVWLCFIILFYFTRAVVDSFLSLGSGIDLFITFLTVSTFISAMLYINWQKKLGKQL